MVLAINPISGVKVASNLDSFIVEGHPDDGIYYQINAQLTNKDTIFITLDCYSDEGVLAYSGTTTMEKIDTNTLRITETWGSPTIGYSKKK